MEISSAAISYKFVTMHVLLLGVNCVYFGIITSVGVRLLAVSCIGVLPTGEFSVETRRVFCISAGCIFSVIASHCSFVHVSFDVFGVCLNEPSRC
jgi:hypothetical protein